MRFSATFLVCLLAFFTKALSDKSCEEELTSDIKMKIVRDSLKQVKIFFPTCRDADEDSAKCGKSSNALAHMNLAIDTLEGLTLVGNGNKVCPICPDPIVRGGGGPLDCEDILKMGHKKSGVYTIYPRNSPTIQVYCDMDTSGGGWTVIQRRGSFSTVLNFFRNWDTYKKGFGNLKEEFWLGNEKIFALTNQGVYTARFDLVDNNKEYRYAEYNPFFIGDEYSKYALYIKNHSGNATDDMKFHDGMMFSTFDNQNDRRASNDACCNLYQAAFWYVPANCGFASLNGVYQPGVKEDKKSVWWFNWKKYECLFSVEVKIRRKHA